MAIPEDMTVSPYSEKERTVKRRRKPKTTAVRNTREKEKGGETIYRSLQVNVYPNHSQSQLLKRWIGLSRYAYNCVIRISKQKRYYEKDCALGPAQLKWVTLQPYAMR
ncbi:hypothetical protein GLOIN_2v1725427 [Rhizophagus irregularis DAOM 181602=DAOM 197198]|uniref:Transposase putative helix-turn-helix domain-containing protein n=1 Tax=Rhizophagus irregularis (strain DAOM 181602 / DAOM 197198 / MUCL 43194) TaxID=747089 RepID=A0A2P4P0Z6_RHIID|nr:hypothetical protein GLOIN_2v1725427 [Rhizophagus irregularis DAOM 181602=DAOM 197198]POG59069.1 hypothetical protein GLOIN_2v1725427 [Rhizophagus irregularis DAOM 181602=DAOM 197198]|eukprot:XP_025165935.1 hypothetical protein GLOIN_2v1725427 [Rhizophagus irregularis DAOM 181602=DAOM 197198]